MRPRSVRPMLGADLLFGCRSVRPVPVHCPAFSVAGPVIRCRYTALLFGCRSVCPVLVRCPAFSVAGSIARCRCRLRVSSLFLSGSGPQARSACCRSLRSAACPLLRPLPAAGIVPGAAPNKKMIRNRAGSFLSHRGGSLRDGRAPLFRSPRPAGGTPCRSP